MKIFPTLAAVATLGASVALARPPPKGGPDSNCTDKADSVQAECSAACFKVDPNKKDQVPTKQESKCMEGCSKKTSATFNKCQAEVQRKADAAKKKGRPVTDTVVEY